MHVEQHAWKIPLVSLLLLQCGQDKDPTLTTTGVGTDDPDGGAESGTPTGGAAGPHAPCERYLECLAATPQWSMDAETLLGEDGTCWQGGADEVAACIDACRIGLESFHMQYPDLPQCAQCQVDGDCAPGSTCSADNECVAPASCGDGILDPGEICDGPGCDPDCAGPQACQPVNNAGCGPNEVCKVSHQVAVCVPYPVDPAGPMEPCHGDNDTTGGYYYETDSYGTYGDTYGDSGDTGDIPYVDNCAPGLQCILGPIECQGESCCMPFCLIGEIPCPDGAQCIWFQYPSPLDYLGVCGTL